MTYIIGHNNIIFISIRSLVLFYIVWFYVRTTINIRNIHKTLSYTVYIYQIKFTSM